MNGDAHCHLQFPGLAGEIDAVLERAASAGVTRFVSCGTHPGDWTDLARLAGRCPAITPFFGLHPWNASEGGSWKSDLRKILHDDPGAGIGEIGLDSKLTETPIDIQVEAFRYQLELSRELRRPCSIHCVHAWGALLDEVSRTPPSGLMLHAYGGSAELVASFSKLGGYFSFGSSVIQHASKRLVAALKAVPLDRLLLESDADGKGFGEPAILPEIAEAVALIRGEDATELFARTSDNLLRFLGESE